MLLNHRKLKNFIPLLTGLLLLAFTLPAMGQEKAGKDYIKVTEKGTKYKIIGWETNVVYNPYFYTWHEWQDPIVKRQKGEVTHMVKVSEFDRAPMFVYNGNCLQLDKPKAQMECSNKEIQKFVNNTYFEYPDKAQELGQEGLEYVSIVLNEDGEFENGLSITSKDKPCRGCADAAADLVASMEGKWYPAIKDGKAVKTHLTIPVRFEFFDEQMMENR